jgi:arsenate reductase
MIEDNGGNAEIVLYLENPPTEEELKEILDMLEMEPIQLVRKQESIWKENFKGKLMTAQEVIEAMLQYPKLIERPIVVKGKKAVLGRPPENVLELL